MILECNLGDRGTSSIIQNTLICKKIVFAKYRIFICVFANIDNVAFAHDRELETLAIRFTRTSATEWGA